MARKQSRSRNTWMVWLLALAAVIAGCGGDDGSGDDESSGGDSTATAPAAPGQVATPTLDPAAAALIGEWQAEISEGEIRTLTLTGTRYSLLHADGGGGKGLMRATATEIEFWRSDLCDGTGTYTWSLKDGALTFNSVTKDECERWNSLNGKTYTRK